MASLVEPNATAQSAPAVEPTTPQPQAAPEEGGANFSPELVQIPAIQGLLAGEPAAFSIPIAEFDARPEGKIITDNKDALMQAGMGFYRSLGGDIGAVFNRMFLADSEIQAADKAGQLSQVAPPFDQVNQMISQSGQQNPVLKQGERPTGLKSAGAPAPTPGPVTAPPPAPTPQSAGKTPARLLGAKIRNLDPGSPTEGPKPGAGRILNQILKPVL